MSNKIKLTDAQFNNIISKFKEMAKVYRVLNEPYREKAYLMAIVSLTDAHEGHADVDLNSIPSIGKKLKLKILDAIKTGTFTEYEKLAKDKAIHGITELQSIFGIGPATSKKLYKKGVHSVAELIAAKDILDTLPTAIHVGLKYRQDLSKPIDKQTIEHVTKLMKSSGFTMELCGSARRYFDGSIDTIKQPNDLDYLLLSNDEKDLKTFGKWLNDKGLVKAILATGESKLMVVVSINDRIIKIDIRRVPVESKATAMLYFTGPRLFNIKMRVEAAKQGYLLNEYGLFHGTKHIHTETEKDVFDKLHIRYLTPHERSEMRFTSI